jgi:hypothetical protein
LSIDISYLKNSSFGGSKYWLLIVGKVTNMMWSHFLRRKPEASRKVIESVTELKRNDANIVKLIRCDNSGENQALRQEIKKKASICSLSLRHPEHHKKMAKLKELSLHYGAEPERCSIKLN